MQRTFAAQVPEKAATPLARSFTSATPLLRQPALMRSAVPTATPGSLGTSTVRSYGTRSVWNVANGKRMIFAWFIIFPIWAGAVQDWFGPYWFFHQKDFGA